MNRFSCILNRLRRLEPLPARIAAWPPKEGSFTYWLWVATGKPGKRQSFWSMYEQRAKEIWKDQK